VILSLRERSEKWVWCLRYVATDPCVSIHCHLNVGGGPRRRKKEETAAGGGEEGRNRVAGGEERRKKEETAAGGGEKEKT